jgi:hypothetical protein
MKLNSSFGPLAASLTAILLWAGPPAGRGQNLTVQVGTPPLPPVPLVQSGETWRYRLGTTAPGAGWQTASEASLSASWLTGAGGFGFSNDWAPETNLCATGVSAMFNTTSTLYTRRTFEITESPDPTARLALRVDWDDGFVAYLDGVEVARFNAPGAAGTEPGNTAVATTSHESSNGNPNNTPLPPTTFDLGAVGSRLAPGPHVLAVLGLNRAADSSDFVLVANLSLLPPSLGAGGGSLFAMVSTNSVDLSGTNTVPGSTRVTVNGEEAAYNSVSGRWTHQFSLQAGLNRLFVAALDPNGVILGSTHRDVLAEITGLSQSVEGVLSGDNVWDGANGTIRVTSTVVVPAGASLRVTNGAVVLLTSSASLRTTNGIITAEGTADRPVLFAPADGGTPWGDLGAFGTNGLLTLRHAKLVAGQLRPVAGGTVLMEDSVIRDLAVTGREMIAAVGGGGLTMRRVYGARFGEMDSRDTPVRIEDCLLEEFAVDGLDIKTDGGHPLEIVRTTLRRGDPGNSNADGIDFGPGAGTVEQCLIYDFRDKGISLGTAPGTTIRDSVIFNCGSGIAVNASTNCSFAQTTIFGCLTGLFFRAASGTFSDLAGTNNILWSNSIPIAFTGNSTLSLDHCDVQGGYPGEGNLDVDPLFVDPANADFRLSAGSPARGAGVGGVDLGPAFDERPVGGLPPAPVRLAAVVSATGDLEVRWEDDGHNESGFELERSLDGLSWSLLASPAAGGLTANVRSFVDGSAALGQRYFYRARALNHAGRSAYSNVAGGTREDPVLVVGGVLTANTTWSPAMGTVIVASNVTVPANISLTVLPGTTIKMAESAGLRAIAGGRIQLEGTAEQKVVVQPLVPGTLWRELSGQFNGAQLTIRHADISGGQITVYSNAVGLIEDSHIHHYRLLSGGTLFTSPIILTHYAAPTVVRRCHVQEYHETLWRNGIITIEECLFERIHGDAVDFDSAQPGTVLRWSTFRHGTSGNVDAVDVGPGDIPGAFDVRIENCMMFDFPFDKGVSVGDQGSSRGTIVSNCFIYACLSGVMAKDLCDVSVRNCTIVNNRWGFTNYNKVNPASLTGGGITTNTYNNILWDNDITLSLANGGQLYADHNILGETNWPGEGNLDVDPLFVNAAQNDYRLSAASPARGAGRAGADLGATFPVGCAMVSSHPRIAAMEVQGDAAIVRFWADNERSYTLEASENVAGSPWVKVADIASGAAVPQLRSFTNAVAGNRFYRLITPSVP